MTFPNHTGLHSAAGSQVGAASPLAREAARVLLVNTQGAVLVLRGHDPDQPERSWWFTPGGGIDAGETPRQAAVRELREESGFDVPAVALVGPVWERTARFDFRRRPYVQHEVFFMAHVDDATAQAEVAWTDNEYEMLDDMAWMTPADLDAAAIEVFPRTLAALVRELPAWDGTVVQLGEETV